jgi:hypothetical protein
MATFAVVMQGVPPFGVAVWAVAILTAARLGIFLLFVVAIIARKPIPVLRRMGFMIKQDASRGGL